MTDLTREQIEALLKRLDLVEAITENAEWGAIAMFDVAQIIALLRGLKINNTREKDDHELSLAEIEAGADLAEHHRRALQAPQFQPVPPSDVVEKATAAFKEIIQLDQKEKLTTIDCDPAGNTYSVEHVDGTFAAIARVALEAITRLGKGE